MGPCSGDRGRIETLTSEGFPVPHVLPACNPDRREFPGASPLAQDGVKAMPSILLPGLGLSGCFAFYCDWHRRRYAEVDGYHTGRNLSHFIKIKERHSGLARS